MGKIHLITKEQQIILDEVGKNAFLQSSFYFTGGSALSFMHLNHRYSDDLDFFSEKKLDNEVILAIMQKWSEKHYFTFTSRFVEVVYIFNLSFQNKTKLKIDFAYYPYKRIEKGKIIDNLVIDSLLDIAINKLFTVSQRTEVKDFVDLYFLLQTFTVWDLIEGVRVKFRMRLDPLLIASDFLKAEDFDYLPKMIEPLTVKTLKSFFRQKAKKIGGKAAE